MSARRRKHPQRRIDRARTALADKYGNLYGIKLRRWFVFDGQHAVITGKDADERKANLLRFEERLAIHQQSRGSSSLNTERRREREAAA